MNINENNLVANTLDGTFTIGKTDKNQFMDTYNHLPDKVFKDAYAAGHKLSKKVLTMAAKLSKTVDRKIDGKIEFHQKFPEGIYDTIDYNNQTIAVNEDSVTKKEIAEVVMEKENPTVLSASAPTFLAPAYDTDFSNINYVYGYMEASGALKQSHLDELPHKYRQDISEDKYVETATKYTGVRRNLADEYRNYWENYDRVLGNEVNLTKSASKSLER